MPQTRVLVEYKGEDEEALIWRGTRAWRQWLTPETIAQIGESRLRTFLAEEVDGVWHIGAPCEQWSAAALAKGERGQCPAPAEPLRGGSA